MRLREVKADLHIHTVLSPCTDIAEMTPRAIVKRALEVGLHLIAICDHNSAENVVAVKGAAEDVGLSVLAGIEITSSEEVHTVGLFQGLEEALKLQDIVYDHLKGDNDEKVFGYQVVMDMDDEVVGLNRKLLIGATEMALGNIVEAIHSLGGLAIASHVDREGFSILGQLGWIPEDLPLDALEVSWRLPLSEARTTFPQTEGFPLIQSSDAHHLEDVGRGFTRFLVADVTINELRMALQSEGGRRVLA